MKIKIILIAGLFSVFGMILNAKEIGGRVYSNGKGLNGVVVSDGINCTLTDVNGSYKLNSVSNAEFVFVSTPSGYLPDVKNKTLPLFYKRIEEDVNIYDFELKKNLKNDNEHMFIVQTDVQMVDENDLNLYKKLLSIDAEFIEDNRSTDIFGFDCGDISGDNHAIVHPYIDAVSVLDLPIYRAVGNHDMDYNGRSHETSYKTFESIFGPVYYSFNRGKAHYVVLNNAFFLGREYFYMGYIDERTFNWLEQNLAYIEKGSPVFIVMHIPASLQADQTSFTYTANDIASQTVNAKSLYKLLEPYKANIISGHKHYSKNVYYNENLMQHISPAVSGAWWQGDICLDGTPQGYNIYYVNGTDVSWRFKSFRHGLDYQFRLYPPGTYKDNPNDVVVNVWNWDSLWKVEWIENGQNRGEMTRYSALDADAVALCSGDIKYHWIAPDSTGHMFKATLSDLNAKIFIKVTDRFGNVFEQELKTVK